jgi:hypothetical protein
MLSEWHALTAALYVLFASQRVIHTGTQVLILSSNTPDRRRIGYAGSAFSSDALLEMTRDGTCWQTSGCEAIIVSVIDTPYGMRAEHVWDALQAFVMKSASYLVQDRLEKDNLPIKLERVKNNP